MYNVQTKPLSQYACAIKRKRVVNWQPTKFSFDRSRCFRKSARSYDCQYNCDFVKIAYEFS